MSLLRRDRVSRGVPTGGRFATMERPEALTQLTPAPTSWVPRVDPAASALAELRSFGAAPVTAPVTLEVAAVGALHARASEVLSRHGVPAAPARLNDELVRIRTAVAEAVVTSNWSPRRRELVLAGLGDPTIARRADRLGRVIPRDYAQIAIHYLEAMELTRREGAAS